MPSVGLLIIYSNHCNTRQQEKTKKIKKDSPGHGASSGEENEQLFGFRPGAKKWQHRGNQPNRCCLLASGICSLPAPRAASLTGQPEAICSG